MNHIPPRRLIKDSVLSVVIIDNFVENVLSGVGRMIYLSPAANLQWSLEVKKSTVDGIEYLSLHIRLRGFQYWKYSTLVGISLINDNSIDTETVTFRRDYSTNDSWGSRFIEMSEVLAENSGFLIDGALTVQCEVRVDVITDNYGIRRFNFHDPFEGCVSFKHGEREKTFFVKKEMVNRYFTVLAEQIATGKEEFSYDGGQDHDGSYFDDFLQVLHGVPHKISYSYYILEYATQFCSIGVNRCLETVLLYTSIHGGIPSQNLFLFVSPRIVRNELKRLLKSVKTLEELKEVTQKYQIYWSNSEMLKTIAGKFFSFAVGFRRLKGV